MLIPFMAQHLKELELQEQQVTMVSLVGDLDNYAKVLESYGPCFSYEREGKVLGCGGFMDTWPGRSILWCLLSKDAGSHLVDITRSVRKVMKHYPRHRFEATVQYDFKEGHRWMKLLGFELEAERMKKFSPDKVDYSLYARVA